jgi:hypothetical protein
MLIGVVFVVLLLCLVDGLIGVVPRRRVERFARLHSLPVTAANGNQIIVYRATTRRWRVLGLAAGLVAQAVVTGMMVLSTLWLFVGWFVGAAVAELRVAHLDRGPRASASLQPRRAADYLPRVGRWAVPVFMALCALTPVFCAAVRRRFPAGDLRIVALWAVFGLGVGLVALAAQRHVLRRPQPLAGPDRLAADDAIRSRSMHVLAAAGMVLVNFCVESQLAAAGILHHSHAADMAVWVIGLGVPIAGWVLAHYPAEPRAPGPSGTASAAPTAPGPA